ncbi:MAG: I78 family peptidase inhibitor [Paracoccaceae bacterium]
MKQIFLLTAFLPLAGCMTGGVGSGSCHAGSFARYIGQPASSMIAVGADGPVRFLRPNQPATMDLEPTRLNVHVGDDGIIKRLTCG